MDYIVLSKHARVLPAVYVNVRQVCTRGERQRELERERVRE